MEQVRGWVGVKARTGCLVLGWFIASLGPDDSRMSLRHPDNGRALLTAGRAQPDLLPTTTTSSLSVVVLVKLDIRCSHPRPSDYSDLRQANPQVLISAYRAGPVRGT
ncbi:hypothetical protein Pcinc_006479 [Petrolisthes cinctipes]|uniref:Uncharacterized protein n=1 Tax=Petrolisthes cinctipes TaxID=88211 RepID=A0AAE1KZI6_PETCI|nr:hypothetical protein Pcinc_006479 [Petrolisthes cinctipes]